jgi:hypothetical protein
VFGVLAADARRGSPAGGWAQAGSLPVSVAAAAGLVPAGAGSPTVSRVRVAVAGHEAARAAGVAGFLFTVSRADGAAGPVRVRVSYAGFAGVYGCGFGSRLTLVAMPACALTIPAVAACRVMRPVPTVNHFAAGR